VSASRTTIRAKLVSAIMLTSVTVLVLTGAVLIGHEVVSYRRVMVTELTARAEILAANSTAALAFQNHDDAREVLSALETAPSARAAALYDEHGELFATYPADAIPGFVPHRPEAPGHRFYGAYLVLTRPVLHEGRPVGTIYLRSDLQALADRLRVHAIVVLLAIGGSIGVAFLLSNWLQRWVSEPVHTLVEATRGVSERRDYSIRVAEGSDDELGSLAQSFNQMLGEIQRRDTEIRQLNAGLERRVAERTAELEASNKELEAFSYSVSHDLRGPLRAVDGFSRMLLTQARDRLDERGQRHLEQIRDAAGHMGQLIDDMLNMARITRADMQKGRVDLGALGREIADGLKRSQPQRRAEFVIPEGLVVHGDSHLLRVALDNLLGNAWKFTSKHPSARIELGRQADNGSRAFFVRDDGAGFDMAHADMLFKPFKRLHRQSEFQGTGVGLATVQRIFERHGGKLWAESAVERGATFYFTLGEERAA
jgi:signal transduction histidine kinase